MRKERVRASGSWKLRVRGAHLIRRAKGLFCGRGIGVVVRCAWMVSVPMPMPMSIH